MDKFLRFWLPVLLYVTLIFVVSSLQGLQPPQLFGTFSDKIPHAVEYGILGFLLVRAIRGTELLQRSLPAGLVALIVGLAVALADELYQAYVPGRQSDPFDYTADAVGLALAIVLFLVLRGVTRGRRAKRVTRARRA
jgi:VanZ family protein